MLSKSIILEIMKGNPNSRTSREVELLGTHFQSMIFYQKFLHKKQYLDIRKTILRRLKVMRYQKGQEVFRHNSVSDK